MMSFRIRLPAEQADAVLKAIEAAKASLDGRDREELMLERRDEVESDADSTPADENVAAETRRARQADAFVRVMESYLEPDARPRATAEKYQVHVHLDLRKDADGPVPDPGAPALAEGTLRRLGGETKLSNLVELCGRHHRLLHEGGYGLALSHDGALVFTRPDGERIPDVPRPPALAGDPVEALGRAHGHPDVSAETWRCHWDGAPPDFGAMVELLDWKRPPPADNHAHD